MPEQTSPWMRLTIGVERPALNKAGAMRWLENVVTGIDGQITVEPAELAMLPAAVTWNVEEYEAPVI